MRGRQRVRLEVPQEQLAPILRKALRPRVSYDDPPRRFVEPPPVRVLSFGGR